MARGIRTASDLSGLNREFFFFQAEDGIRDDLVTGVQTCALPIYDFATGTVAAAWGGTTTIVDFAVQSYGETLAQGLDRWLEKAGPKSHIDYGLHLIVREISDGILREMDTMIDRGVPSFKLFMAYPGVFMLADASIFRAMSRTADNGGLIMLHAGNGGAIDVLVQRYLAEGKTSPVNHGLTRPSSMAGEATPRAIPLAGLARVPGYIHHLHPRG